MASARTNRENPHPALNGERLQLSEGKNETRILVRKVRRRKPR
jgi:hypothetical protein